MYFSLFQSFYFRQIIYYASYRSNLIAIELLNEPAEDLEAYHHDELRQYYSDGYDIIRKYSSTLPVVFNVLWSDHYADWE
jgi:aryl-phospho-beta-D-glucosidase BglC (GH1 family)